MADFYGPGAHWAGLACPVSSQLGLQCEECGHSKTECLDLNFNATIWPIGLILLGKHLNILSRYGAEF